jgi:pyridoxamine 5'-phosphate oxidase-like protein
VASWQDIEDSEPDFAARLRALLDAHVHKTIATIRADGSPRISGTETFFAEGDLWFGSMSRARKARDLQRDPRFALHSGSDDPPGWGGDAKLTGEAEEIEDPDRRARIFRAHGSESPPEGAHLFRAEIREAVIVSLNDARDRLVVELWKPGEALKRVERE